MNIKKIKPLFCSVITTMDKYDTDSFSSSGILEANKVQGSLKEYQKVIAVGPIVQHIKVGDMVAINPSRFAVKKYQDGSMKDGVIAVNQTTGYNFPVIEIDGIQYLHLQDRDIDFIIEEYEEEEVTAKSPIIQPAPKSIIV